jgi:hypothetical protein
MINYLDLTSIFAGFLCLETFWQLFRNWSGFWDAKVTAQDGALAQRLAMFVLLPIGILLHEIGHSLATWQVGGTVAIFQWRFYWGYMVPTGNFSPVEYWWIAFSGNLVSILLGLLPILFISCTRRRIVAEILYSYACVELVSALVIYPLLSVLLRVGDWVEIYNFSLPYATPTLIGHVGLLWGLWHLYHSPRAIRWRLAHDPHVLSTWEKLKADRSRQPDDLPTVLAQGYLLLRNNELYAAKKLCAVAADNERVMVLRVVIDCASQSYRKAIKSGQQLLALDLIPEDRLRLYRILCLSSYQLRRLTAALYYANQGLVIAPRDCNMRWHRAKVYWMLGKYKESKIDSAVALASAQDGESRQLIREWLKQHQPKVKIF